MIKDQLTFSIEDVFHWYKLMYVIERGGSIWVFMRIINVFLSIIPLFTNCNFAHYLLHNESSQQYLLDLFFNKLVLCFSTVLELTNSSLASLERN